MKKIIVGIIGFAAAAAMLTGCGVPKNEVHSVDDLKGKTIGVQVKTTGSIFASDIEDATVKEYDTGADAVEALKEGDVDAVIIDADPAKVYTNDDSEIEVLDEAFAKEDYAIAVKLGNTALQEEINQALKELEDDGTLLKIKKNYEGDDIGSSAYTPSESADRSKGTLVMATNAEFPPYESKEGDDIVGFDVDMMWAICDKLGYELEIKNMSFESIIPAVQSGDADVGVAGMTVTEDRMKNVLFTDTYTTSHQVIIVRSE